MFQQYKINTNGSSTSSLHESAWEQSRVRQAVWQSPTKPGSPAIAPLGAQLYVPSDPSYFDLRYLVIILLDLTIIQPLQLTIRLFLRHFTFFDTDIGL
ncbi:putative transmembrane protein, partial [Gregarina niphandrodes]